MSCDPNGYPWRADRIDPGKVPKAGSPAWNERGDYVTPSMTTPPDDPRADDGLVEAVGKAIGREDQRIIAINEAAAASQDWRAHISYTLRDQMLARAALTAARSHGGM